jgi:hypothetical protein
MAMRGMIVFHKNRSKACTRYNVCSLFEMYIPYFAIGSSALANASIAINP